MIVLSGLDKRSAANLIKEVLELKTVKTEVVERPDGKYDINSLVKMDKSTYGVVRGYACGLADGIFLMTAKFAGEGGEGV